MLKKYIDIGNVFLSLCTCAQIKGKISSRQFVHFSQKIGEKYARKVHRK